MADQWHYTDPEWSASWDDAWRPTPRWLSAFVAERPVQSFDWPTPAQQSWYRPPAETAIHTGPSSAIAPSQDTHCSGQDAYTDSQLAQPRHNLYQNASTQSGHPSTFTHDASTQLSWSVLSRRRVCSKKRPRAADHRPNAEGSPAGAHAGSPLVHLERRDVPPLLRSSRSACPPQHPPPPGLDVQHHQPPSRLIPSKAKPLRSPQTHNANTVQAAKPMRLKTVISACPWPGGSSCRTPQPQTPQASFWLALTTAQQVKFVASLWMPSSTAAVGVGGGVDRCLPQWPGASLM